MSDTIGQNSRRHFYKVTYSPLKTRDDQGYQTGDALGRAALLRALRLTPEEVMAMRQDAKSPDVVRALDAVSNLVGARSAVRSVEAASRIGDISNEHLLGVVALARTIREQALARLTQGIAELDRSYVEHSDAMPVRDDAAPGYEQPVATHPEIAPASGAKPPPLSGGGEQPYTPPPNMTASAVSPPVPSLAAPPAPVGVRTRVGSVPLSDAALMSVSRTKLGPAVATRLSAMTVWAEKSESKKLQTLIDGARQSLPITVGPMDIQSALLDTTKALLLTDLVADGLTRRPLEPVGLLHLERLEMTPLEVERGELLYSLPLAPEEKVTLAHREWSLREEEFEEYIQDFLENYSEKGVTETEEMSSSTQTQTRHANALSMSQSPASTNGVTITTPVDVQSGASSSVDNIDSQDQSKDQSRTVTSKASARTIRDHKVSFTVTTVSGTEDFTARLLKNPHSDHTLLIDYFRRMRRWQTDLYCYGVRMTYDIVLPDPGRELRSRNVEVRTIDAQLATPFAFNVQPTDIQPLNWETYANTYGVALQPPPSARRAEVVKPIDYDPAQIVTIGTTQHIRQRIESVEIPIGSEAYEWESLSAVVVVSTWHVPQDRWMTILGGGGTQSFTARPDGWIIATVAFVPSALPRGNVTVVFQSQNVSNGLIRLTGTVTPTAATMEAWRIASWKTLHDSAYADYLRNNDRLRERRAVLTREMASFDSLALRRVEREQIMRAVLEWLFPGFNDASSVLTKAQNPGSLDADTWRAVMEYGEYIKLVQSAVDWDNVLVLLFPYFWDTAWNQSVKLFLDHPDPVHREFLRAGAARIVLAIKPGFEEEMVSLLDRGQLGKLPHGDRFAKVVTDVEKANGDYAKTGPANPEEGQPDNPRLHGKLIGTWFDYTPTAALDIEVTIGKVKNS